MPKYKNAKREDFHSEFDVKTFDSFESYQKEMDTYKPDSDRDLNETTKQIIEKNLDNDEIVKDALAYMYAVQFLTYEKTYKWETPSKTGDLATLPEIEAMKADILDSMTLEDAIRDVRTEGIEKPRPQDLYAELKGMSPEELGEKMKYDYNTLDGFFGKRIDSEGIHEEILLAYCGCYGVDSSDVSSCWSMAILATRLRICSQIMICSRKLFAM